MAHLRDHHFIDEQANYNRGRAQQDVIDEADNCGQFVVAAIFSHVGAGQNAERRADQHRDDRHHQAAGDRIEQTAGRPRRRRHFGEDRKREAAEAFPQQHRQNDHQPAQAETRRPVGEPHGDDVAASALCIEPGIHCQAPTRAFRRNNNSARDRQHDESNDEQDQAKSDQRRGIKVTDGFGEFVGNGCRNCRAGCEQRTGNAVRIADDECHGHRLAERATKAEHDSPDHADAGVRQYDVACDLPGRAAESVGRLLEHGRHGFEHIARDGRDERQDHDRENEAGSENADAVRRACEQRRQNRDFPEHGDQERLHVLLQKWREDEQAPDAVDDTGNAGEQLDGYADRATQPHRAKLSQEQRDEQADGHRDQHRNKRGNDGAVYRRDRSEFLGDRIPNFFVKEAEAKRAQSRQRTPDQRNDDAAEDDKNSGCSRTGQMAKCDVAKPQPLQHPRPIDLGSGRDARALQRHINHGSPPRRLHRALPGHFAVRRATQAASRLQHKPSFCQR